MRQAVPLQYQSAGNPSKQLPPAHKESTLCINRQYLVWFNIYQVDKVKLWKQKKYQTKPVRGLHYHNVDQSKTQSMSDKASRLGTWLQPYNSSLAIWNFQLDNRKLIMKLQFRGKHVELHFTPYSWHGKLGTF